ncbi:type IV pilus secretin PilQ [Brumicola pallidula]|jgi:type IV pilus assembly protein PilQ|uniref:Type IV pilus assembly protein PilQ n=1 Tax=Brumicola pallidula DSM 14239 = ACAM 615 TaxID=1121922 RepID=K6ZEN1_9ALTE|nr:type IV pilus secretin PilQ family protein [Glaciecola pallidula]GAC28792.1 type IV pilus assembly protein PilQ [Glaciecola pallidula DSM 14239 = ACAM 615]
MSDKYIFNKRLNSNRPHWVLIIAFVLAIVSLGAVAQESENLIDLVDPQGEATLESSAILNSIDFNRFVKTGNVLIGFEGKIPSVTVVEAKGLITLTMKETMLAEDQYVEVDVSQFGTAVNSIETFQDADTAKVEIRYNGVVKIKRMEENGVVTLAVTPLTPGEVEQSKNTTYEGKPISLDFQDVPVRQVLQIIAQVNGFNLVTTDTVNGNVTISLSGVPWDQALDMILKIRGLDKRLEGNILLIAPTEELSARETQQLQSKQQVQNLAQLKSAHIEINYAKADEIATILKTSDGGILSDRGNVTVDARTNTILIRDTLESIDEARRVINALDIPVKQVLIESRMVTVRDNVDEQLGVRWGFTGAGDNNSVSGSIVGADTAGQGSVPDIGDRLNVNLPVSSAAGTIGFQIANLLDGNILDLELSALEAENKGEIIASPRITVANQQEAYIEQGTEIPFVQATSSGATSVEFKKAVLSLKVTPHITPDDRIILNLVVTQDTRGDTVATSTGPAVAIDTQEISTQVLVENGETIVLGGIFQQVSTNDVTKVPLLGDIPYFGNLFKTTSTIEQKRELLIFVTPKIIEESF